MCRIPSPSGFGCRALAGLTMVRPMGAVAVQAEILTELGRPTVAKSHGGPSQSVFVVDYTTKSIKEFSMYVRGYECFEHFCEASQPNFFRLITQLVHSILKLCYCCMQSEGKEAC